MIPIPVKLEAHARDITFEFEDSCNCCCFSWGYKRPNPQTQVYVNSEGVAERFDPIKTNSLGKMVALTRSVTHLNLVIEHNAQVAHRDVSEVHAEIVEAVGASLDEDSPGPLTMDLIERVNLAMNEMFNHIKYERVV